MSVINLQAVKSVFFENTSIRQVLFKNTFWITLSEGLGRGLRTILLIYLARVLGATDYGKFSFALSFISIFISFLDLGLSSIITRELSSNSRTEKDFPALFTLKIILGISTALMIWVGASFITPESQIRKIIRVLGLFSCLSQFPEIFYAFWRAKQRMEYEAWANMGSTSLLVAGVFFVIFKSPSIENISYIYLFSSLITFTLILLFFNFKGLPLKISASIPTWKKFLAMSWPLALTSIFSMLYGYTDSILMGHLGQLAQTGWYNAALKIINVVSTPTGIISLSFFPVLSKFARESLPQLQKAFNYQMGIMVFLAIPIMVAGISLAPQIIQFLYGSGYIPSIKALRILLIMSGLSFFCNPLSNLLVVHNQQHKIFWVTVVGAVVNITANFILIPKFSLYGAAMASVISYCVIFFLYLRFTLKFTPIQPFNREVFRVFTHAAISAGVMYAITSQPWFMHLHVLITLFIGIVIYLGTFLLLRKSQGLIS